MSGYPGQGYQGGYQHGGPPQQPYPPQVQGGYYPPQPNYNTYQPGPPRPPPGPGYAYHPQQPSSQPYGYNRLVCQPYNGYGPPQLSYGNRPTMPTANSNAYSHGNHNAPAPPPTTPQQFGHGAPSNYSYQYSNCTGRRKALLIGINYFGQHGQLRGCINDVKNMSAYLVENFGYKREDMVILTDDQQNPMSQPTKQNLLRAMHWLVKDARPNDSLFFHYSGHGGQTKDLDGDEEDGYDEVIYPVDFRQNGHITDDEMHRIMVKPLVPGVRLTAIFDSCHSGTALDLPYIYNTQGILKQPNLAKEAGQGLLGVISSYSQGDLGGVASNLVGFFKKATNGEEAYNRTMATKTSPADVIMLSGSKDDQTSADATIASQATGAMSWAFITSLKKNPQQSYVQLLNSIRDELATKYTQKPQLSCSHPLSKLWPVFAGLNTFYLYVLIRRRQTRICYLSCRLPPERRMICHIGYEKLHGNACCGLNDEYPSRMIEKQRQVGSEAKWVPAVLVYVV
ncbi:hypothetical protein SODALDRAFT_268486 [Sodiomyces alkalinus F11]|uniref:Peptidase C14 caspase domain-containing protein n=1 Tax=Sodiomyces alkalinus (strain CBS 110278 / VKM F-3762 / F11) TaxID=1314773 RepID=A0A3N2Q7P7_SODAK|nr:hypothetical protein SODALDRAFT_268486 [Sodiomyces alkalinus F11]ROT42736.1 hypothetical protein SODALDRAFT_268486 [Sodiomyces alkalinus F11]